MLVVNEGWVTTKKYFWFWFLIKVWQLTVFLNFSGVDI